MTDEKTTTIWTHEHQRGILSDRIAVDDDGVVIYEIAGHMVTRDDYVAYTLGQIRFSLQTLAGEAPHLRETFTPPRD